MTIRLLVLCAAPLALAACGSDKPAADAVTQAKGEAPADLPSGMSDAEIASQMKNAVRPRPGQYESTAELVSLEIPGIPAEEAAKMKAMMGESFGRTSSRCLTRAEAEKGFEELAKSSQEGCRMDSFTSNGAKFAGRMICDTADAKGTVTMSGTGTETGSQMTMTMNMQSPGLPGGAMAMEMKVASRRTGDCKS
ncbi:DUF3617 domain-containing protein [Croceicoccus sp. BE223]|uniref:DUF3617 domain-containing protein n=1 Tax=Croceicoccus sp. BE223 TaxID=2817716 RepID=UPI002865A9A9|nr:DUF3617 domain-containing protein [Croceicoccus sp. BE223]MDR7104088.1 hypothetical protein [Croceicoccus sp. BE223]